MMLRSLLASSRYIVVLAVLGIYGAAMALLLYESAVIFTSIVKLVMEGDISPKTAKVVAVGVIEGVDVFLIAVVMYLMSLSLYALFIDDTIPLPKWLKLRDLDDLKAQLVSAVIVVLAVIFLREAVGWDGQRDLLRFGAALALVILVLTLYLVKLGSRKD
jgi:uncharacterized membrane protein YqhA